MLLHVLHMEINVFVLMIKICRDAVLIVLVIRPLLGAMV